MKYKGLLIFSILMSIFTGCDLKDPILPSWQILVRIPFTVEKFAIGDSLLKSSTITLQQGDPDSILYIAIDGDLDAKELTPEDLAIEPEEVSETVTLDTLELNPNPLQTSFISLRSLLPELSNFIGQTITIPETTVVPPPVILSAQDYQQIHVVSATMLVTIDNRLPVSLGPNNSSNGVELSLFNDIPDELVTTILFPNPISGNTIVQQSTTMTNQWLYNPLRLEYNVPIAQPTAVTITDSLLDNAGIQFRLEFIDVRTDDAIAEFDAQNTSDSVSFGYDSNQRLIRAEITQGTFTLEFDNHIAITSQVELTFPNIDTNPDPLVREPLTTSFTLPANGTTLHQIVLDNTEISNPTNPNLPIDSLDILVNVTTEPSGGFIHLTAADSVRVTLLTDSIFLHSLTGLLTEDTLTISPVEIENIANYEGFEGNVQLSSAELRLTIYSELFIENLTGSLTIVGYHENSQGIITDSAMIDLQDVPIQGGVPGNPGESVILLVGEEVAQFLNILPTSLKISGEAIASGEADIIAGQKIWANYAFETPLKVQLNIPIDYTGEVDTLTDEDISDEIQDIPDENFIQAMLQLKFLNHTALGGSGTLVLSGDPFDEDIYDSNYDSTLTIIREVSIAPGEVDPVTGFVIQGIESNIELGLTRSEIRVIQNPPVRVGFKLRLNPTNGFITMRKSDYFGVNGGVNLEILVRGDQQ